MSLREMGDLPPKINLPDGFRALQDTAKSIYPTVYRLEFRSKSGPKWIDSARVSVHNTTESLLSARLDADTAIFNTKFNTLNERVQLEARSLFDVHVLTTGFDTYRGLEKALIAGCRIVEARLEWAREHMRRHLPYRQQISHFPFIPLTGYADEHGIHV